MFNAKKVRKPDISHPTDFKHVVHTGIDRNENRFVGLPAQWQGIIGSDVQDSRPLMRNGHFGQGPSIHNRYDSGISVEPFAQQSSPQHSGSSALSDPRQAAQQATPYSSVSAGLSVGSRPQPQQQQQHTELAGAFNRPVSYGSSGPVAPTLRRDSALLQSQMVEAITGLVDSGDPRQMLVDMVQIDQGSTGTIWRAVERESRYVVAVKRVSIAAQMRKELLYNELSVMKQVYDHENIINFYSSFLVEEELWIVMEYMDGGSLAPYLSKHVLQEFQMAYIASCVLRALAVLHQLGVVHRDVKSDSVLVNTQGDIKLSDLGFCGRVSKTGRRRSLVGTPYWISPEVISRQSYGCEADIWSMGIFMVEMIDFGEPPFYDDLPLQAMRKIRDNSPPITIRNQQRCSDALVGFIARMLDRDVNRRPMAADLLVDPFILTNEQTDRRCLAPLFYPAPPASALPP